VTRDHECAFPELSAEERILITSLEAREPIIQQLKNQSLEPKRHWVFA
jgi:hypothetical protein